MIHLLNDPAPAAPLFHGWPETILWSCLQGVMGAVYGDDPSAPRSAAAVLGDFRFLAGQPSPELADLALREQGAPLLIPRDSRWDAVILRQSGGRAVPIIRYATRKDTVFDRVHLEKLAAGLEDSYTIRIIDHDLYDLCKVEPWSRDLVSQFPDWNTFRELGLGFAVIQNERLVSGAASYARYREGIEIEIDTHPDFRRLGLALACGARLILECLDRGMYPSWDAHTPASLALAERLGYQLDRPYAAFAVYNT
ncbi:GNAT family N-acetyltransferase [uncultured Dysosmobacter sp.]|uniref:GNAT family N-acetyltransferase n=1 Tax=uncultured Dysosmobacter sp. TaxID=2591384 RepID=UPI002616A5E7|nr:GNAT family N-acetyltransferase [uncultured Dysosmobacter sp.]